MAHPRRDSEQARQASRAPSLPGLGINARDHSHPDTTGTVERYQRILAEELLYARPFTNEDERATALQVWNIHYNYHRPHGALQHRPPAALLRKGVTKRPALLHLGVHEVDAVMNAGRRSFGERVGHPHDVSRIHILPDLLDTEPARRRASSVVVSRPPTGAQRNTRATIPRGMFL